MIFGFIITDVSCGVDAVKSLAVIMSVDGTGGSGSSGGGGVGYD